MESMVERADKYAAEQLNAIRFIWGPECTPEDARAVLLNHMAICWLDGYRSALQGDLRRRMVTDTEPEARPGAVKRAVDDVLAAVGFVTL